MSEFAIRIEGIGKKYLINHNKQADQSYTAFRDVISDGAKGLLNPKHWGGLKSQKEEFWALKYINLEIKKGEKIGIIGKNGAGKSTLLKILSRITAPTEGRVKINGRVSSLLEVGTGFHPELTGRENIYLNGSILGMPHAEIKKQFDEIVDFSGVEKFIDTPVKQYSSGMKTRLGFAIAAHLQNDILILDEVLAVGDAEFQKKCLSKMDEVSKTLGKTVVFVSHDLNAQKLLCDSGFTLNAGKVIDKGCIKQITMNYLKSLDNWHENIADYKSSNLEGLGIDITGVDPVHDTIGFGDKLSITVKFYASKNFNSLLFAVSLVDIRGAFVATGVSNAFKCGLLNKECSMTLDIPHNNVAPGVYSLNIAIGEGVDLYNYRSLSLIRKFGMFEFELPETDKTESFIWKPEWGGLMLSNITTHEKK